MVSGQIDGVDVTVMGLKEASNAVLKAAFAGVIDAATECLNDCKDLITETDHSLHALALMGHPYGHKHPQEIHDPDVIVHFQSGEYASALKVTKPESYANRNIIGARVGIMGSASMKELDQRIQLGTEKMRARPWAQYVVDQHGERYAEIIESAVADAVAEEAA